MANQDDKSEKALKTAAESGDTQAMYDLGLILEQRGELNESAQWMSRASESGLAKASFHVARFLFENGREDLSEEWFEKAVKQGSEEALDYQKNNSSQPETSEVDSYGELTSDQKQVMQSFIDELAEVIATYGISPVSYEEDELDQDDIENNRVWSIVEYFATGATNQEGVEDDAYRTDAMLSPGFEEGAIQYLVSKIAYSEEQPLESNPYTSLFFNCSACDFEGCEVCDEAGFMVYGAVWDDTGVTFSRELP